MTYLYVSVIIVVIILLFCKSISENFSGCMNCGYADELECGNCSNCGYCISSGGKGECVPGDVTGPYFRDDCAIWKHPDQFRYYSPRFYGRQFHKF